MEKLVVSSSPHIRSSVTTRRLMGDVLIALAPATIAAVILFGLSAFVIIFACVATAVLTEYLFNLVTKKKQTVDDLSAVVTGLLLALNIHADVPVWQCVIGAVFSILVVKCLFGGLGCNFANPAITGRVFMLIAFSEAGGGTMPLDLEASATPLESIGKILAGGSASLPSIGDMFLGIRGGAMGETCAIALLLGFVYLVVCGVIDWYVPATFVGTVYLFSLCVTGDALLALYEILSGGLLIGAIFMATDYVTGPINKLGRVVFAFGCGLITCLIRFFGSYPEGVSFAILFMNILSPYIENWTAKRPLGGAKK